MNLLTQTYTIFLTTVTMALGGLYGCTSVDENASPEELDRVFNEREQYVEQKKRAIASIVRMSTLPNLSLRQQYEINEKLYQEYRKYKLDSAITCMENNAEIAQQLNDNEKLDLSYIRLAQLFSYTGRSIETKRILQSIHRPTLSKNLLPEYYETYCFYYQHYATISRQDKFERNIQLYRDSIMEVSNPNSYLYRKNKSYMLIESEEYEKAEALLFDLLRNYTEQDKEYGAITNALGYLFQRINDKPQARKYYTLSAIADLKNAVKENASFQALAFIFYENGDLTRACRYAQAAIDDALLSGVQFRTAQMSRLYANINAAYQVHETKSKTTLKKYLLLISVLSLLLVILFINIYSQMRRLSRTKVELSTANNQLRLLNERMNEKNLALNGANELKEQYIAQFFDMCSMYIDKMENYRKSLNRLAQDHRIEDLIKGLKSTSMLEHELEELYKNFDAIFLDLYPTFVTDFNALLNESDRITLKPGELMNKELRIYALLRLGITDSNKIASFLHCSLSTIYNYRTQARNRANTPRESFEEEVMSIGETHHEKK